MGQRILTALALIAVALLLFFSQSLLVLWTTAALLFFISSTELNKFLDTKNLQYMGGVLLALPLAISQLIQRKDIVVTVLILLSVLSLAVVAFLWSNSNNTTSITRATLLGFYVAGGLISPLMLLTQPWLGWTIRPAILLIFVPVWAADSAGYFVGKAYGKHLLAPIISPKKTIEGAVGNFVMAILAGIGVAAWCRLPIPEGILIGALVGVFGQIGDLFESQLKRGASVKDSGNLLPGHGGILDRIDSLLLTAPLTCLVLALLAR